MDFHGVKVAILVEDSLLVHLRDNKPGLFNANMWDCPGGGREGNELPIECAIRETYEELELKLEVADFIWSNIYPAQKDPTQQAFFFVAKVDPSRINNIVLREGQKWALMSQEKLLSRNDVVSSIKLRFRDFLQSKQF